MKVLLVQDVEKLGSTGDIKEVSGGYGRNYLIPPKARGVRYPRSDQTGMEEKIGQTAQG